MYALSIIKINLVMLLTLLIVTFTNIAKRKTITSIQRRLSPNIVRYYGLLQAFVDIISFKKYSTIQVNLILFFFRFN